MRCYNLDDHLFKDDSPKGGFNSSYLLQAYRTHLMNKDDIAGILLVFFFIFGESTTLGEICSDRNTVGGSQSYF